MKWFRISKFIERLFYRRKRQNRKGGFTFIEILFTSFLLGLLVITVQSVLTNLFYMKQVAGQDVTVYRSADNLFKWIYSGKGLPKYLLTEIEKRRMEKKGADFSNLRHYLPVLASYRFNANERKYIINKPVKLDGKKYRLKIERKILEPAPFLIGIKIELIDLKGQSAVLKGILSYYDLEAQIE